MNELLYPLSIFHDLATLAQVILVFKRDNKFPKNDIVRPPAFQCSSTNKFTLKLVIYALQMIDFTNT